MLKKTITYVDYDGNERTEDFYFNLSKAELMEMQLSVDSGLTKVIEKIAKEKKVSKIAEIFKDLILKSYGEKSDDGKRFIKSKELRDGFEQTEAYSILYMELATDANAAIEFMKGIVPSDLSAQMKDINADNINDNLLELSEKTNK